MADEDTKVERRNQQFAERIETRIWLEQPADGNPYAVSAAHCHGYNLQDLLRHCSYWEFIYLLLTGRRCDRDQQTLLEKLGIALANPGPRHPATRAVMAAAVSKTETGNILPLGLAVLAGSHLGAGEVGDSMYFLRRALKRDAAAEAEQCAAAAGSQNAARRDMHPAPGFGTRFGGSDVLAQALAAQLLALPGAGRNLAWADQFARGLEHHGSGGWLMPGLAAAAFLDLGFHPRMGPQLFQWLSAPGLMAHAEEMANKPLGAFPFVEDDKYFIDDQ